MQVFFHAEQLLHHPRIYLSRGKLREPPETPERAARLLQAVEALGFGIATPPDRGMKPLLAVHDIAYLRFLQHAHQRWKEMPADWGDEVISNIFVSEPNALRGILAEAARYLADGSCPIGASTWRSAYWSAQSAIAGAHALMDGHRFSYSVCRPPGHHARRSAAGGFSYLNNTAIAAQALRDKFARVAVLDVDMHHGQGVQDIFYRRNDILYVSVHGDPTNFYPVVCGHADERGADAGYGYNLNLPMPHRSGEETFFRFVDDALGAVHGFAPDALVVALGFDIYKEDPQSLVEFSADGFRRLGQSIAGLKLPTLVVQEGGYHIETLGSNATRFFNGLHDGQG